MTPDLWIVLIVAIIGSGGVSAVVVKLIDFFSIKRKEDNTLTEEYCAQLELITSTLKIVAYNMLSDKLDFLIAQEYATTAQRRDVEILKEIYLEHGWNGEIEERMKTVYDLPFHRPTNRRSTDKKGPE